jgi:hypothetical protein
MRSPKIRPPDASGESSRARFFRTCCYKLLSSLVGDLQLLVYCMIMQRTTLYYVYVLVKISIVANAIVHRHYPDIL